MVTSKVNTDNLVARISKTRDIQSYIEGNKSHMIGISFHKHIQM